jgi:hypothetical protein
MAYVDSPLGIKTRLGRCRSVVAVLVLGVCLSLSFWFGVLLVNWFFPLDSIVVVPILRPIHFAGSVPFTVGSAPSHIFLLVLKNVSLAHLDHRLHLLSSL